jgi:L-threonylcarbamoyladenylate synthase
LSHGEPGQLDALCSVVERLPADAAGYAADLYAALHRLDDREVASIAVVPPPADADDSWYAIRDRLQRAACAPQPAASAE